MRSLAPGQPPTALLEIPYHGISAVPGEYQLPFRRHLIAIPEGADASLQMGAVKTRVLNDIQLERLPVDEGNSYERMGAEIFEAGKHVTLSKPFRFRRFRVVEVTLQPCLYNPGTKSLTMAESIEFSLTFTGGRFTGYSEPKSEWLEPLILNYRQALGWGLPPARESNSNWPQGTLLEIIIDEAGMYRIQRSDIVNLNIDPSDYPLSLFSLYNNGGRELPTGIESQFADSLIENAIYVFDDDGDDVFDPEDYVLFYGRGTFGWEEIYSGEFRHYINHFTYDNSYWLELKTSGEPGRRMQQFGVADSPSETVRITKSRVYREDERVIYATGSFPGSGLDWYGDLFAGGESRTYRHNFSSVASGYIKIRAQFRLVSGDCQFQVYFNNSLLPGLINTGGVQYIPIQNDLAREGNNSIAFKNITAGSAYLDWYELEYKRNLQASSGALFFEAPLGSGIAYFDSLSGLSDSALVFKITDFTNVKYSIGTKFKDNLSPDTSQLYCAYDANAYLPPKNISLYHTPEGDFADLRDTANGAEHIYITHSDFYDGIAEMAEMWRVEEGVSVGRVDVAQVFDQFSWGLYDPTAIRNFLRYAVENWEQPPKSVTLVGDADYDYFNRLSQKDKNWVPTYESGLNCTDDFFAYLHTVYRPELALGRFPVNSVYELSAMVDKTTAYVREPDYGPWRGRITLVADDEFGERGQVTMSEENHVRDSEAIAQNYIPRFFNLTKIYLTEYDPVPGGGGRQKPNAANDLVEAINRGCVLVNFFGHGNESIWAHEGVFQEERDLPRIDNGRRQAIFIGATCTWGYFDNPLKQSMPEKLVALPGKGAIACIGGSRSTTSGPNESLVRAFFVNGYREPYSPMTLGDALMRAKLSVIGGNSEKYHLFGEPLLRPCSPRNDGELTDIEPDSLFALNLTHISGRLFKEGEVWSDFQGTVYIEVLDAAKFIRYDFKGLNSYVIYEMPGNGIFRGPVSAAEGDFEARFVIPMDVSSGGDLGRINFYFYDQQSGDGLAYEDSIYIGQGGIQLTDSDPPAGVVYLGDRSYRPGNTVSSAPLFIADLSDSTGINLSGSAGHEIKLTVDGSREFDLTEYFEYSVDSYQQGSLQKQLDYLGPGLHEFKFRFFDSFNQPSQLVFSVETADSIVSGEYLYQLLNYPNPFSTKTAFTFWLLKEATVKIEIYTVAGRKIKSLGPKFCVPLYVYDKFFWDGRDHKGDKVANGAYLYKVKADFGDKSVSKIGRIIVMR